MKHNLLKSLIISVILLTGVSNAWALDIYLDCSSVNWPDADAIIKLYPGTGSDVQGSLLPSGVYKFTVLEAKGTMWFKRINPNNQNQTWDEASIQYNASQNNVYKLTGWKSVENADYNISIATPTNYIYFDNSTTGWGDNKYFVIGHDKPSPFSRSYTMTNITNTMLWYTTNDEHSWTDATFYSFLSNQEWNNGNNNWGINKIKDAKAYTAPFTSLQPLNKDKYYLCIPTNKNNNQPFNISEYSSFESLNHTQTIVTAVKNATGQYEIANSKAIISAASYKMNGNNTVTSTSSTINTDNQKTTISAAHTATTTLMVDWGSLDQNYKFEGWYDEKGNLIKTDLTYTYYPTEENTIYARFTEAPSRIVYFKPNKVLNKSGDRFVACWEGHIRLAEEMEQIECSEYYKYEIPGKYEGFEKILFYKIKTDADDVFDSFSEIDDAAGETADLSIPATNEPNKLYDMSKVYLKPNNTGWESDGARFAAYFWVKDSSPIQAKWMSMFPSPENDGTYYCDYPTDYAYDNVIFCRMNPAHTDNKFDDDYCWNKTNDLCLYKTLNSAYFNNRNINKGYGNLFQINSFTDGTTTGEWKNKWTKYTATTTVTLVADSHGTYKVTCSNGTSQTSALNEDRTLSVPLNSTITIETVQPQPGYAQTQGAAITIGTNSKQAAILGNAYAICGATTITGNFVAEKGTIYLEANANWNIYDARFFAHVWHDTGEHDYEMTSIGKYFSCTLEDDYHSIVFYRKNPDGDTIWCQTNDLFIPTDNQRIYEITSFGNGKIGDNGYTPAEGTWKKATALIKIDPCEYGQFGIVLENETIWCDKTEVKPIEVPLGTTIEIIDFDESTIFPEYKRNPRYKYSTIVQLSRDAKFINLDDLGLIYTVQEDIWVVPNIVMSKRHTVYLHIPTSLINVWNGTTETYKYNTMYLRDYLADGEIFRGEDCEEDECRVAHLLTAEKIDALSNSTDGEYWCFEVPDGYHAFVIERKNNADDKNSGEGNKGTSFCSQAETFFFRNPLDKNNCYTLESYTTKDDKTYWKGSWGEMPNCTVELGWCPIGKYGVMYDGKAYYSTTSEPITSFEVPYDSELTFIEGKPVVDIYDGGIMVREPSKQRINDLTQPYRVTSDVLFDDNFVTKKEHVFYLGVPDDLTEWNKTGAEYYIWTYDQADSFDMLEETCRGTHMPEYDGDGYKYYKFTLQPGRNEFRFEHKIPTGPTGNNSNTTLARTAKLTYQVPITNENCYKLDGSYYTSGGYDYYQGTWEALPARVGDYRLLYAEKELIKKHEEGESEDWETAFRTIYSHPSDVIRKRTDLNTGEDTVSLHIYTQRAYDTIPMVILQQYQTVNSTNQWVDIEAHTVLPLKAHGNMGMLPGRKKAYGELPFYSDGIDAIKDDLVDKGSGVWNFIVEQAKDENTKNMTTTLHLGKDKLKRYEGTYYIRTTNTLGGWINYYNEDNHMKFSSYSKQYRGFSHYYCKWVDITKHSEDVRFVVANDYGSAISKELIADTYSNNGEITENANIRWSWNIVNNKVSRAYIQGTWNTNSERLDNIVAKYKTSQSASDSRELLDDTGDWIYSKDIKNVQVGSQLVSLTAQYPSGGDTQIFAEDMDMLIGEIEHNQNKYVVRILYDFKIDKTMVTLVPDEKNADIAIDVLIERIDQGEATQVRSNITNNYKTITNANGETEKGATVYAMMTFNKAQLTDSLLSDQRRFTYWISFPFDVNIADVFGFSEYGKQWRIRTYNSRSRAENGYNGTQTYWEYIDINQTPVLEANKGYILVLNAKLRNPEHSAYTNRSSLSLYFPSANLINNLDTACIETSVVVPRNEGQAPSKDWNWNMIGVPSYANKDRTISQDHLYYFFEYNYDTDSYEVCWAGKEQRFKSMFAYMVQFAGTIDWTNFKVNSGQFPEQLAAKKDASAEINHVMRLELLRNNQREDKTYIQLTENENATEQFDMNFDLTKMANAKANLYSLIGNHQLAANVLPLQTTVVPLGVIIKTAGEYTFSMPDGTAGITAELIDYQTNTRTNLLLDNYTVTLPAGTNNSRFALSLQPDKTVTSIDNIGNEATGDKVKKYLIDGKLYLQKDGVLYDAQGHSL